MFPPPEVRGLRRGIGSRGQAVATALRQSLIA
jgi:hypothetical protein